MIIRITAALVALLAATTIATASASANGSFSNATPIPINGTPTSSAIEVSGQTGRVSKVTVALGKFHHPRADEVDVLLVSPDGKTSVVMSDLCGGDIPGYSWSFSQDFALRMGTSSGECGGFFYRPSDAISSDGIDTFPGAPPGPVSGLYRVTFDQFLGAVPNGTWRLYVTDDHPLTYDGAIDYGWVLNIETDDVDVVVPGTPSTETANPYPVTTTVNGLAGVVEDVDVKVAGVYDERPADLDLLLVGPDGHQVMLMSNLCGGSAVRDYTWTFDDEAPDAMPAGNTCVNGGRYKPTQNGTVGPLPPPAPQDGYETSLSAFDYTDPNGQWKLYVLDHYPAEFNGFFAQRFELKIATRPPAAVSFAQDAVEVSEGERTQLTLTRPAAGRNLGPGSVTIASAPLTATSGEDFKSVSTRLDFAPGQTTRTFSVQALADAVAEPAEAFTLTIGQPTRDAAVGAPATATVTIPGQAQTGSGAGTGSSVDPGTVTQQPVDRQAPVIGRVTLAPAAFTIGRSRAARGTKIRFSLSEPAAVSLKIQRAKGRRFVTVGTLRRTGRAGANRVAFTGRIRHRALRRGSYRLIVSAVDVAGNRATAPPRRFRIV
jgi:subtilisin-like proprotein convertase family protein